MASTKYFGYVGGAAVAMGVGAAIAVAGQGTAHADSTDSGASGKNSSAGSSSARSSGVKAGPKRSDRTKPLSKVNDRVEKVTSQATKTVSSVSKSISDSLAKPTAKPSTRPAKAKAKPSAEEFEAKQVEQLKNLFTPKQAATPTPDSTLDDKQNKAAKTVVDTPTVTTAVEPRADARTDATADAPGWSLNPFRPDDPDPKDIPEPIMELRNALMGAAPDELKPVVREATEQIYRGSQIVPWVNVVIPITKILPNLAPAVQGDLDARQIIINELIKTTPPGAFLYYGYDIGADLLNFDTEASAIKSQVVGSVWDLLDPFQLAHNKGTSGIEQAVAG